MKKIRQIVSTVVAAAITTSIFALPARAITTNGTIDGWTVQFQNKCIGSVEIDNKEFANGNGSLKVTCSSPGANSTFVMLNQYLEVEEGRKYYIGANFKSDGFTKAFWTVDWGKRWDANTFGTQFDWKNFEVVYTAEKTGKVNFIIAVQDMAKAVWIDDIKFIDSETNKNLVTNGKFDTATAELEGVAGDFPASYTYDEFLNSKAGIKYMPVYKANGINVDGDKNDWAIYPGFAMPKSSGQFKVYMNDGRDKDIKGEYKFAYDDEYLYMMLDIEDNQFTYVPGSNYWQGDSIQFAVSTLEETYGIELGVAYNPNTKEAELYGSNLTEEQSSQIKVGAAQEGENVVYEVAMPWTLHFEKKPDRFLLDVLVNENDGDGRRYALEIVPGIASGKTNAQFPIFENMTDDKEWICWLEGAKNGFTKNDLTYTYYIVNTGDKALEFTVKTDDGTDEVVAIPAKSGVSKSFTKNFLEEGAYDVGVEVSNADKTVKASITADILRSQPSVDETKEIISKMRIQESDLKALIDECEEKGFSTDYEKPIWKIIGQFATYLEEDMAASDLSRVYYTQETTTELYNQAKADLESYLDGSNTPKEVQKFLTSDVIIDGQKTIATVGNEDSIDERPVFFVGYGHSDFLTPYIEQFKDYGMNTMQNEAGTAYVIKTTDLVDWQVVRRANGDVVKSTNVVKLGGASAKLSFTDEPADEKFVSLLQYVDVVPGKTYEFKGNVKADGVFGAYADLSQYGFEKSVSLDGTYDWKEFSYTYTVPEGITRLAAQVHVSNATTGLYLDGLSVCEAGSSENLLVNPDFEETKGLGLKFDKDAVQDKIKILENQYKLAEENDISFDLNVSIQKSWTADIKKIISEYNIATGDGAFVTKNHTSTLFTPHHPKIMEAIELYLRNYMPMIAEYDCIDSFCISNEPQLDISGHGDFYKEDWCEYLKEKYNNDITFLNRCYVSNYTSFEEVGYFDPQNPNPAHKYDQKRCADILFGEFHKWMADIIKEYIPDAVCHSKIMGYTFDRNNIDNGTGLEEYSFYDANGCDSYSYLRDHLGPVSKNMWYDHMTSMYNLPVYNSEDHIIKDSNQEFGPDQAKHSGQDIYMGAIHGRSRTQIWLWNRDTAAHVWGSLLYRPDVIWEISKASLDLNRNAYEITALQEQDREVGIIYASPSILNDDNGVPPIYEAYAATVYNGQRALIVTDTQSYKVQGLKLVIVPNQKYVNAETIDALVQYIKDGGRVVILGRDSLKKNEYNLDNDAEKIDYIFANSEVIDYDGGWSQMTKPEPKDFRARIRDILKEENAYYASVIDVDTGEQAYELEYNIAPFEGDILVNINNFETDKKIKVMLGDKVVEESFEIRDNKTLGEIIEIGAYESITLRIKADHTFLDILGHWAENDISALADKKIVEGMSESKYSPNTTLTRAQFLALLTRASGWSNTSYKNDVPDVSADAWYAKAVAAGTQYGIINSGDNFRPNDAITREDMCSMLVKCYEAKNGEITVSESSAFSDNDSINNKSDVDKAVSLKLMYGRDDGTFGPHDSATRAEAAAVVSRFIG